MSVIFRVHLLLLFLLALPTAGYSLEPQELLVVANSRVKGSVELARYYMQKRNIPESHLLKLSLDEGETMSRKEYDTVLAERVRRAIEEKKLGTRIAAVVLIYGVPLKVAAPPPGNEAQNLIDGYRRQQEQLGGEDTEELSEELELEKKSLGDQIRALLNLNQRASVDSELSLVKAGDYELDDWIKNPYYIGNQREELSITKDQVLLVTRLDGPDVKTVRRVIDDTIWAEEKGLRGRAYFDARWPKPEPDSKLDGYGYYDYSLHRAAEVVGRRLPVTLDEEQPLFPAGACPEAAIYCGWYSLGQYVDSFQWQRGAIGYHIASAECTTLRRPGSNVWCKRMLEEGVAATIGPVHEPYVQGFPVPQVFFSYLLEGYMSLGEAYLVSLPYISWQMVMIGDPLYQPFTPAAEASDNQLQN